MEIAGYDVSNMLGLPSDPSLGAIPPGINPDATSTPPAISSVSPSLWDRIKQFGYDAEQTVVADVKGVYGAGRDAVGTVVSDVTEPARQVYWYAIFAVIVVAAGLYYVGKGGAVKVSV